MNETLRRQLIQSQSTRTDEAQQTPPIRAALYAGIAYIVTVMILIAPYLAPANPFLSLALAVAGALTIILAFSYCVTVAKDVPFWHRSGERAGLSLSAATVRFALGYLPRIPVGVDV
jgi:VIT1/CCC1 family predicted Fe2+/Mn2+ transporter